MVQHQHEQEGQYVDTMCGKMRNIYFIDPSRVGLMAWLSTYFSIGLAQQIILSYPYALWMRAESPLGVDLEFWVVPIHVMTPC